MILALLPTALFANAAMGTPTFYAVSSGVEGTVSITSGFKGDVVAAKGTGATAGTSLSVYWDNPTLAWNGAAGLLNSTIVKASGAFDVWFTVPEATHGLHYLWFKDSGNNIYGPYPAAGFTMGAKVKLSPSSGLPADTVTVTMTGYPSASELIVRWDSTQEATPTTNSLGTATATFTVPTVTVPSSHTVTAFNTTAGVTVTANAGFGVGPVITLQPTSGAVGDIIHVTGRGWVPGTTINEPVLSRTGYSVNCLRVTTPVTVDLNGRFRLDMVVSGAPKVIDDYTITASSGSLTSTADFEVTALQAVAVTPVFAPQGAQITVSGTHYSKDTGTTVTVDLTTSGGVLVTNLGTVDTASDGSFSKVFTVPAQVENQYKIAAYIKPASYVYTTDSTGFRVGTMGIQLSSTSGPVGKSLTITGNGFTNSGTWNATIGTDDLVTSGTVTSAGLLQGGSVYIPKDLAPGVYTITVLDISADIKLTAQFTVTYKTSIALTPNAAPNGYNVSVTGSGFRYATAGISFTLYNKTSTGVADYIWSPMVLQEPASTPVSASVNATGFITAYWIVPASGVIGAGKYYLNATDANGYLGQTSFTVLAKHVVFTPRKTTFGVGDTISFQIEHTTPQSGSYVKVFNPNGTLVFQGDTFASSNWVQTGLWNTVPYSAQVSAGNPMVLPNDASLGTWSAKWYDGTSSHDLIKSVTFVVAAATPSQTEAQITALSAQITALTTQLSQLSTTVGTVATTANAASAAATSAAQSATAAATAATAASTAASAAGGKADSATAAANAAATAAQGAQSAANGLTTLVYAAIGASLVAALAAIVALMQISRKIA